MTGYNNNMMKRIHIFVLILLAKEDYRTEAVHGLKAFGSRSSEIDYYQHTKGDFTLSELIEPSENTTTIFDLRGQFMKTFFSQAASIDPNKSIICSPLSALLPLGKLAFGAEGRTLKELLRYIGVRSIDSAGPRFKKLLMEMALLRGVALSVASRIYLNNQMKLYSEFRNKTKDVFTHSVEPVDVNDPRGAAQAINLWVKHQTKGKIGGILTPNDISPYTVLLLVNAVHFKGNWKHKFTAEFSGTFYGSEEKKAMTMMSVTSFFKYHNSRTLGSHVIMLPYNGSEATFMIVLPRSRTGLNVLINQLRLVPGLLNRINMKSTAINLTIPKFTVESDIDLAVLYKNIGLKEIFDRSTGFKNMVHDTPVTVDMARQMALIEVTKEGTEAAASSAVQIQTLSSLVVGLSITADHPFLYFIVAKEQMLFAGTFTGS